MMPGVSTENTGATRILSFMPQTSHLAQPHTVLARSPRLPIGWASLCGCPEDTALDSKTAGQSDGEYNLIHYSPFFIHYPSSSLNHVLRLS